MVITVEIRLNVPDVDVPKHVLEKYAQAWADGEKHFNFNPYLTMELDGKDTYPDQEILRVTDIDKYTRYQYDRL